MKTRKVIMMGTEMEFPEARAEDLVRRGQAQFPEILAGLKAAAKAPETAAAKAPENAAKAAPKTTSTKKAPAKRSGKAKK
jgi:hypothetical protein